MSESWPYLDGILAEWKSRGIFPSDAFKGEMQRQGFWLAGVANEEFLKDVHGLLGQAMYEGKGLRDVTPELQKLLDKYGGQVKLHGTTGRAKSAYKDLVLRNATQGAFAQGRYAEMFSDDWMQLAPFWKYVAVRDARTRPTHAALHGRVFRKDDLSARKYLPPWQHQCRCQAVSMSLEEFEQGGHQTTNGDDVQHLPTKDGKFVGQPEGSWNVDRAEQARRSAVGEGLEQPAGEASRSGRRPPVDVVPSPPPTKTIHPDPSPIEPAIRRVAEEIRPTTSHEVGVAFGPGGPTGWRRTSPWLGEFRIPISDADRPDLQGMALLHNHPNGMPFTLIGPSGKGGDVAAAALVDLGEVWVTARMEGADVLARIVRPARGWPSGFQAGIDSILIEAEVKASGWAKGYRQWVMSLPPAEQVAAMDEFNRAVRWDIVRRFCAAKGIPFEIIAVKR